MKTKLAFIITLLFGSITLVGQSKVFNNDTIYSCNVLSTEIYYSLNHDSILWSNGNKNDTTIYALLGAASCTVYLNGNSQLISFFIKSANNTGFPIIGYFNTANNGSGGKLSSGFDLHWQFSRVSISGPYSPATVVSNPTSAWYSSPWPNANWISGNPQGNHEIQTDTTYYFRNSFSLPL